MSLSRSNDSENWYKDELTSKVVAETGIPTDAFHLGKLIIQSLKDDPDFVLQIDGGTGESETCGSVLNRSIRCAISLKKCGLQVGDVILLMAPHHLNLSIPLYAATYLGVISAAVDYNISVYELRDSFELNRPKIIFCQSDKVPDIQMALNGLKLSTKIVTLDKTDHPFNFIDFLVKDEGNKTLIENFKPTNVDTEEAIAFLWPTSGTTGITKSVAMTYKNCAVSALQLRFGLAYLSGLLSYTGSAIVKYTRLQTSKPLTKEHASYLINTYKPTVATLNPTFMEELLKANEKCDFTCFKMIVLGGSAVHADVIDDIKRITPTTGVFNAYGMTELASVALGFNNPAPGSCGKLMPHLQCRLINVETQEDINEPYVTGELWFKGPSVFKEYYRNPEATREAFAEDGWFRSGDLFYSDENFNYFYVERLKMLLKYKWYRVKIESVIRKHPGVFDVVVTGLPDPDDGDLIVACVVRRPNHDVTAQEIKDLVKGTLSDAKQLRGGVVFMNEFPLTAVSSKVNTRKIKETVEHLKREQ